MPCRPGDSAKTSADDAERAAMFFFGKCRNTVRGIIELQIACINFIGSQEHAGSGRQTGKNYGVGLQVGEQGIGRLGIKSRVFRFEHDVVSGLRL